MAQLILRNIEEAVVRKLKEVAGQHGISMEEEHRRLLRESLLGKKAKSFKKVLLKMPNVGKDEEFGRESGKERDVEL